MPFITSRLTGVGRESHSQGVNGNCVENSNLLALQKKELCGLNIEVE